MCTRAAGSGSAGSLKSFCSRVSYTTAHRLSSLRSRCLFSFYLLSMPLSVPFAPGSLCPLLLIPVCRPGFDICPQKDQPCASGPVFQLGWWGRVFSALHWLAYLLFIATITSPKRRNICASGWVYDSCKTWKVSVLSGFRVQFGTGGKKFLTVNTRLGNNHTISTLLL